MLIDKGRIARDGTKTEMLVTRPETSATPQQGKVNVKPQGAQL